MGNLTIGFRAVEGLQPIKLPDNIGVMDLTIVTDRRTGTSYYNEVRLDDPFLTAAQRDIYIDEVFELTDTTTFSIIFSPTGKLVIHEIRIRNRGGERDTVANINNNSYDDIFNKKAQVDAGIGMFYQDDYYSGYGINLELGLGPEISRRSFVIYDKIRFDKTNQLS